MTHSYKVSFDKQEPNLHTILEDKCQNQIRSLIGEKGTMIDYSYKPNTLKYMSKSLYQPSGYVCLSSFGILILLFIIALSTIKNGWFSGQDMVKSIILFILISITLIITLFSGIIYRLKPKGFTIVERSYELDDSSKNLYDLIPSNTLIHQEIQPYLDRAIDHYLNDQVKKVLASALKTIDTSQDYDIKEEHVLLSKILANGDEDSL